MRYAPTVSVKDRIVAEALLVDKGTCPERMLSTHGEVHGNVDVIVGRRTGVWALCIRDVHGVPA